MIRHYPKSKLFNHSTSQLIPEEISIWSSLPPYTIARFGGELSQVMLKAAEQYIFEKSLAYQQQSFEKAAFPGRVENNPTVNLENSTSI
jgi:hypothetical protein